MELYKKSINKKKLSLKNSSSTNPWELMESRTKNDSDKTQDIHMPDSMFLVY